VAGELVTGANRLNTDTDQANVSMHTNSSPPPTNPETVVVETDATAATPTRANKTRLWFRLMRRKMKEKVRRLRPKAGAFEHANASGNGNANGNGNGNVVAVLKNGL
jgi:hypothetical protein